MLRDIGVGTIRCGASQAFVPLGILGKSKLRKEYIINKR
jgi:hypothetical protein